jgi:hypothetical protein
MSLELSQEAPDKLKAALAALLLPSQKACDTFLENQCTGKRCNASTYEGFIWR